MLEHSSDRPIDGCLTRAGFVISFRQQMSLPRQLEKPVSSHIVEWEASGTKVSGVAQGEQKACVLPESRVEFLN
jgi:hypothetical protein